MSRILTGIQSTGTPHLGNILGAMIPAIDMANHPKNESFLFIADMHSLTQIKDSKTLKNNTFSTDASWIAFCLDVDKTVFYRQSDVPQVTELSWYLSCFFPYQRLTLAHSFKDKADHLEDVNSGLFSYPMLMAADILIHRSHMVPVGKDQEQNLEMTRTYAKRFNHMYKTDLFPIPRAFNFGEELVKIPGLDGSGKMGKSEGEGNAVFLNEDPKVLRKKVMRAVTDSGPTQMNQEKPEAIQNLFSLLEVVSKIKCNS